MNLSVLVCFMMLTRYGNSSSKVPLVYLSLSNVISKQNEYVGDISVGTTTQDLSLKIGTSSDISYLYSVECSSCASSPHKFVSVNSTSFVPTNSSVSIEGKEGTVCKDTFTLPTSEKLSTESFPFIFLKDKVSANADGMLGLGFNDNNATLIEVLASSQAIKKAAFSLYKESSNKFILTLGDYKAEYIKTKQLELLSLKNDTGIWTLPMISVKAGKDVIVNKAGNAIVAFEDEYIEGPKEDVKELQNWFKEKYKCITTPDQYLVCSCDQQKHPELQFEIDSHELSIPSSLYFKKENSLCTLLVKPGKDNVWKFGQPFMSKYYVVFYLDDKQIGIAISRSFEPGSTTTKTVEKSYFFSYVMCFFSIFAITLGLVYCTRKTLERSQESSSTLRNYSSGGGQTLGGSNIRNRERLRDFYAERHDRPIMDEPN